MISDFNGCFDDVRCIATINLLQARRNAASAIASTAQGGFVRIAVIGSTKMLRSIANVRFGEAAPQRRNRLRMSAKGR
ncbi:MAG: hypothetical protein OSA52_09565 [Yoonia sp.]|nr:hypothetical protein [Yoonia sp.]